MGDHANSISVIVPALDEEAHIASTLESISFGHPLEVILADGGSSDGTRRVARRYGARIVSSTAGRAKQMNQGASVAQGDILLFVHADTCLPRDFDKDILEAFSRLEVVAGAFELRIDARARSLRWIERMANWRSHRLQMPYGDQAVFVRAELFRSIGGFPELPIMEDFEMVRRLKRRGCICIVRKPAVTSARRWLETGILRTTFANQLAILAYLMGMPSHRIASWHRRRPRSCRVNSGYSELPGPAPRARI